MVSGCEAERSGGVVFIGFTPDSCGAVQNKLGRRPRAWHGMWNILRFARDLYESEFRFSIFKT